MRHIAPFIILSLFLAYPNPNFAQAHTNNHSFTTNRASNLEPKPTTKQQRSSNAYDLSFVTYDSSFSTEFGLVEENISALDEGIRYLEVRVLTVGDRTNCYYTVILDKTFLLALPQKPFNPRLFPYPMLPQKPYSQISHDVNRKGRQLLSTNTSSLPYLNRFELDYGKYLLKHPRPEGSGTLRLQYYYEHDYLPYQVLSLENSCYAAADVFIYSIPNLLIAKDDNLDFNRTVRPDRNHFHIVHFPQILRDQVAPVLQE